MADPPRDAAGYVIPYDDPDIGHDDGLIRRINPNYHLVRDRNTGSMRLSTAAFSESTPPPGGMSVDLEQFMNANGLDSLAMLPSPEFGAVRLLAGDMREMGHRVGKDPLPNNAYHGEVWDIGRGRAVKRRIMEKVVWIKKPAGLP